MLATTIKLSKALSLCRFDSEYYNQPECKAVLSKELGWSNLGTKLKLVQYGSSHKLNEDNEGYRIFRLNEIEDCILTSPKKFVELPESQYISLKLEKNDVLYCRTNGSVRYIGRIGILKENIDAVFASYLVRLRPDEKKILPEFLPIYLSCKIARKFIERQAMQSNQFNLSAEQMKQIPIPSFEISFQQKIKKMVDEAAKLIQKSNSAYKQATKLFVDHLKLSKFNMDKDLSYDEKISDVFNSNRMDAEYFQPLYSRLIKYMKKYVEVKPLSTFVKSKIKKGTEIGGDNYVEEGFPFIRVSNLEWDGYKDNDTKFMTYELYDELKEKFKPKIGSLLLTKDASPGIAHILKKPIEGIIASGILELEVKKNVINDEYLAFVINSIVGKLQVEKEGGGTILNHWYWNQIKNLQIPLPSNEIQKKIGSLHKKSYDEKMKSIEKIEKGKNEIDLAIQNLKYIKI